MIRALCVLAVLGVAGCVKTVRVESVTFDKVEGNHVQVVARLDTDLRDREYVIHFEYSITESESTPWLPETYAEYLGRFQDPHLTLRGHLLERRAAAVSEHANEGPPFPVRLYLPWTEGESVRRVLSVRVSGFTPYRPYSLSSNTHVSEILIPDR